MTISYVSIILTLLLGVLIFNSSKEDPDDQ